MTGLQSDAGGVKTRFAACEVTPDTRRKQASCEQLGAAVGVKMNHSETNVELREFLDLTNVSCQTKKTTFKG